MVAVALILATALVVLWHPPAQADEVGAACVIDGQSLSIDGKRRYGKCRGGIEVRLFGIVAPGVEDTCLAPNGDRWQCGRASAAMLLEMTKAKRLDCHGKSRDQDGRLLATCYVGGQELNRWMVHEGWALANSAHTLRYKEEEEQASREGRGLWQSLPGSPFAWRSR